MQNLSILDLCDEKKMTRMLTKVAIKGCIERLEGPKMSDEVHKIVFKNAQSLVNKYVKKLGGELSREEKTKLSNFGVNIPSQPELARGAMEGPSGVNNSQGRRPAIATNNNSTERSAARNNKKGI